MKKVLILIGILSLSLIASANMSSREHWKVSPRIGIGATENGIQTNIKLLRNFTDYFRGGFELGFSQDPMNVLTFGGTTELDFYRTDTLDAYINASVLWAYSNENSGEKTSDKKGEKPTYDTRKEAEIVYKAGVGIRLDNGLGLESGAKYIAFKTISKTNGDSRNDEVDPYIEINYTL